MILVMAQESLLEAEEIGNCRTFEWRTSYGLIIAPDLDLQNVTGN